MKLEFGFRQESAEEAIKKFEAQEEVRYRNMGEMGKVARLVDAKAHSVKIPRKVEIVLFSKRFEFTRIQEFPTAASNGF